MGLEGAQKKIQYSILGGEQTFPHSQSGGMNWLCDTVTNCMVVWGCPWAACNPYCPLGPVGQEGEEGVGSSLCPPRPALWLAEARDNRSLQENH